jgi:hypothetical protein
MGGSGAGGEERQGGGKGKGAAMFHDGLLVCFGHIVNESRSPSSSPVPGLS